MRGLRVLGLASKELKSYEQITRADAERDMEFLGFLVLENKLKNDTKGVI
jgi:magnesium-transporting ATPase (P-type)